MQACSIARNEKRPCNGMIADHQGKCRSRAGRHWVIPTENEWLNAAYHKNDGVTGNNWNYPTSADNGVGHELIDPNPGNNATFSGGVAGWTISAPYYRTEVGAHENRESPDGTFDQEWKRLRVERSEFRQYVKRQRRWIRRSRLVYLACDRRAEHQLSRRSARRYRISRRANSMKQHCAQITIHRTAPETAQSRPDRCLRRNRDPL